VVGYSSCCAAPRAWVQANDIDSLRNGRRQVYYHILPDTRDLSLAPPLSPPDLLSASASSAAASSSSSSSSSSVSASSFSAAAAAAGASSSSLEEEEEASGGFEAHAGHGKEMSQLEEEEEASRHQRLLWMSHARPAFLCGREVGVANLLLMCC
jgi:hypothetical protein